jgi:hypothetical protein
MATDVPDSRRQHHVDVIVGHPVIGLTDHVEIGWAVNVMRAHQPTIGLRGGLGAHASAGPQWIQHHTGGGRMSGPRRRAPTSLLRGTGTVPSERGEIMKYMILLYGSQQDYDVLAGKQTSKPAMSPEEVAAMHEYMGSYHEKLVESGEFVDARGLTAPVHARRVQLQKGSPEGGPPPGTPPRGRGPPSTSGRSAA